MEIKPKYDTTDSLIVTNKMTEKKPGIDLKPCPFCGSDSQQMFNDNGLTEVITCNGCFATIERKSITEVFKAWNHRHTDEQHAKELQEASAKQLEEAYKAGNHNCALASLGGRDCLTYQDYKKNGGGG